MKLTDYQISKIHKKINISENRIILMIDVMGDKTIPDAGKEVRFNIYCVDNENNIVWQVQEIEESSFRDGDPFCYLKKDDNGEIIADRFSGFIYRIDSETGIATRIGFHK